ADALLAHVIGHQEIDPLALELRARVRGDVVRLGGEAHHERVWPPGRHLGEDVRVRGQLEGEVALALDLRARGVPGAVVGGRRSASTISSMSGNRPLPLSPEASAPVSGSSTVTPRRRKVATLAVTAACSHMPPSMAGTMSTGARAASKSVVRKSSAMPCAAFASTFAVAGATMTAWARSARATCSTASALCGSKRFESTARPDRVRNVSGPKNSRA